MKKYDLSPFATLLRDLRQSAGINNQGISRSNLAIITGVTLDYINKLEQGKRHPSREIVAKLADALGPPKEQRKDLFEKAYYSPPPEVEDDKSLARLISSVLNDLTPPERKEIREEVADFVAVWKKRREIWRKGVRKVVIPVAGWQSRLLAPDQVVHTLVHALEEVRAAGILEVILVIPPTLPPQQFNELDKRFGLTHRIIVQESQLGLGHAVLLTEKDVGEEPFGVLLPDDVDPERRAMGELVARYLEVKKPLLAVMPESARHQVWLRYGGKAVLGTRLNGRHRLYPIVEVREKGEDSEDPHTHYIVGRYVLTPPIFKKLNDCPLNNRTGQLELTDALARLLRSSAEAMYGCDLNRALLPCAPVRAFIEEAVNAIDTPGKLRKLLDRMERIHQGDA